MKNNNRDKNRYNPLRRCYLRELKKEWFKYLVLTVLLISMIGFVSGVDVANNSMAKRLNSIDSEKNLEDGHFEMSRELDGEQIKIIESGTLPERESAMMQNAGRNLGNFKLTLYPSFFKEKAERIIKRHRDSHTKGTKNESDKSKRKAKVRVYTVSENEGVNRYSIFEGREPRLSDEIIIDRMHADNSGIRLGDKISVGGVDFKVVGLAAFSNYSALFQKNSDLMFDALKFDVASLTEAGFERIEGVTRYNYAWKYSVSPKDEKEESDRAGDIAQRAAAAGMLSGNKIMSFLPRYANSAVNFTKDDIGSDKAMSDIFLIVLVIIIAFIFGVTSKHSLEKEARAVGTLRASGYTMREMVSHYMKIPTAVGLIGCIVGNILGYTYFKDVVVKMYYRSYSLPPYVTLWNSNAFITTTLIPLALIILINALILIIAMRISPLQFLRGELRGKKKRRAVRLPQIGFFRRFRLRIIIQNLPDFLVLFVGINFIVLMLSLAIGLPRSLEIYQKKAPEMVIAKSQIVLTDYKDERGDVIETAAKGAEKFSFAMLTQESDSLKRAKTDEDVALYGIMPGSRFVKIPKNMKKNEVNISSAYAEKYKLKKGDTIKLSDRYHGRKYKLRVAGITPCDGNIAAFMPQDRCRSLIKAGSSSFDGYMADDKIGDIDTKYIAYEMGADDVTKAVEQLTTSMGSYMYFFQRLCFIFAICLIYLTTKLIIEKNGRSISFIKLLGYNRCEVASLYIIATAAMIAISTLIAILIESRIGAILWGAIMMSMRGWITFDSAHVTYIRIFLLIMAAYLFVAIFDFRKLSRIPPDMALKEGE